jgi:hypothetical protein
MNIEQFELLSFSVILLSVFLWGITLYAPRLKRAKPHDIDMLVDAISCENLTFWGTYIGEFDNKIYIDFQTRCHPLHFLTGKIIHTLYWIPIDELSLEILIKLQRP